MPNKKKKTSSQNYWAISTILLAIILIITLITNGNTETTMDATEIGQKLLSFANNQGAEAGLVSVNDAGQFYEVVLSIQGQEIPLYVTKDGKSFTQQLIPLETQPQIPPRQTTPTPSNTSNQSSEY